MWSKAEREDYENTIAMSCTLHSEHVRVQDNPLAGKRITDGEWEWCPPRECDDIENCVAHIDGTGAEK